MTVWLISRFHVYTHRQTLHLRSVTLILLKNTPLGVMATLAAFYVLIEEADHFTKNTLNT